MGVPFYVIDEEADPADPGWVDFERVYGLNWDKFTDADWERFNQTLRELPEVREAKGGAYAWYSADDDPEGGYIFGSVEPPGLHVYGSIDRQRLSTWHDAFRKAVVEYPLRSDMEWAKEA